MKLQTGQVCLLILACYGLNGCSSMMTHSSYGNQYYPGTLANNSTISDDKNDWTVRALAVADYPFSLILDTLLLPWDYFNQYSEKHTSLHEQVSDAGTVNRDK